MRIIDDVNLDQIVIERDGTTLRLEFIDMCQGAPIGVLQCKDVILVNYHNILQPEGLAEYVGEVDICELAGDPAKSKLRELGFGFLDARGEIWTPEGGKTYHVHVEGGAICIDICCGDCRLTGAGWPKHSSEFRGHL